MAIAAQMIPAFDHIVETTKPHLESIPDDRLDWRPHEKSWTIGELGSHIANVPMWTVATLGQDAFDVAPDDGEEPPRQPTYDSSAEMVAALERNAAAAREAIQATSDETFMTDWTLLAGGEARLSLPKVAVLRSFIMDHMIHHRGQLTVYLRMLDIPLRQTFGPTADFPDM
jgi:uncharacterized damage-inducible protein DinB